MTFAARLALVAWQLVLVEPTREILSGGANPESLSNIELLIPLVMRPDRDEPFSDIPPDAFSRDDEFPAARGSRKRDLSQARYFGEQRLRSLYLQPSVRAEPRSPALHRVCSRLARGAADVLRYLCRELLDLAGPAAPLPAPTAARACPCCETDAAIRSWRRDLIPLGDNPYMRPPPPWLTEPQRRRATTAT